MRYVALFAARSFRDACKTCDLTYANSFIYILWFEILAAQETFSFQCRASTRSQWLSSFTIVVFVYNPIVIELSARTYVHLVYWFTDLFHIMFFRYQICILKFNIIYHILWFNSWRQKRHRHIIITLACKSLGCGAGYIPRSWRLPLVLYYYITHWTDML